MRVATIEVKKQNLEILPEIKMGKSMLGFLCHAQSQLRPICSDKGKRVHQTKKYLEASPIQLAQEILQWDSPILYPKLELESFDYNMVRQKLNGKIDPSGKTYRDLLGPAYFALLELKFDYIIFGN